jgi:hypothetical protein
MLNIKEPGDLATFGVVTVGMISVCIITGFQGVHVDFTKRGKDFRCGANQRYVFHFALMMASLYKFICMTIEALVFSDSNCADSHFCSFVRFSPDVGFLTAYSVMLTFWAQVLR